MDRITKEKYTTKKTCHTLRNVLHFEYKENKNKNQMVTEIQYCCIS